MRYIALPNTLGKYHEEVFKFPFGDSDDELKILLFVNKLGDRRPYND